MNTKNSYGLKNFSFIIIQLISEGNFEETGKIEQLLSEGRIVDHLSKQYPSVLGDKSFSGKASVENFFKEHAGCFDGIEDRKFGLKENDGLLLLLSIIINDNL